MSPILEKIKGLGKKESRPEEAKVSRRRYSKEEIATIESLISEGLTNREISLRLGRSEAGIRNLRYRRGLIRKAEDETKALLKQRDQLSGQVNALTEKQQALIRDLEALREEKRKLEALIRIDKALLQNTLTQALTSLKMQRPDLFTLSGQDQIAMLTKLFFENILR